jgi:hypothetical protein
VKKLILLMLLSLLAACAPDAGVASSGPDADAAASELSQRSAALSTTAQPWAFLVLAFKDDPIDPATAIIGYQEQIEATTDTRTVLDVMESFFTSKGNATFNVVRYFDEMSHGAVDMSGNQVFVVQLDLTYDQAIHDLGCCQAYQEKITQLAKEAAVKQGVPLQNFFGIAITSHHMLPLAQGSSSLDGTPWTGLDYRWMRNQGMASWAQEMLHGFGLQHSRRDGIPTDYLDPLDSMSTLSARSGADPDYGLRGPGLNAWNMRSHGWLDESRVYHQPGGSSDQTIELRPLHQRDLPGYLAAELGYTENGFPTFLIEYRKKEGWDSGLNASSVSVRRFEGEDGQLLGGHSYLMAGSNGKTELQAGDSFKSGDFLMTVVSIDDASSTATVRLGWYPCGVMCNGNSICDALSGKCVDPSSHAGCLALCESQYGHCDELDDAVAIKWCISNGIKCRAACDCVPTTCAAAGAMCGSISDGCGHSLDCGNNCPSGSACSGNQCVCVPKCSGKQCGSDGCGGTCGTCPNGGACTAGKCPKVCDCNGNCHLNTCGRWCGRCPRNSVCTEEGCTSLGMLGGKWFAPEQSPTPSLSFEQ